MSTLMNIKDLVKRNDHFRKVVLTGKKPIKLFTVYSPPAHAAGETQKSKPEYTSKKYEAEARSGGRRPGAPLRFGAAARQARGPRGPRARRRYQPTPAVSRSARGGARSRGSCTGIHPGSPSPFLSFQ